jgi:uncharacterized membrane-anchored protein YitT (DUF2179 family)
MAGKALLTWRPGAAWETGRDYAFIALGALLQALGMRLFLVPARLASGGVSGMAQIINFYSGWPIGLMVFLGNIPLFLLGWRYLGGLRFALRTAFAVLTFSLLTDVTAFFLPPQGLTSDLLLNTLYGGVVSGVGYGLVYRGRGTSGGSDILARILNHWRGLPISQSYLMVDALMILAAGLSFGWERALYALVMLYISGIAAEGITEGTNVVRTVLVVTDRPQEVAEGILRQMGRGVTLLPGIGGYSGAPRTVVYTVVSRSEVPQVKALVREADPRAFMVIGHAHEVLGEGFKRLEA